jgi:hypothetical protein
MTIVGCYFSVILRRRSGRWFVFLHVGDFIPRRHSRRFCLDRRHRQWFPEVWQALSEFAPPNQRRYITRFWRLISFLTNIDQ